MNEYERRLKMNNPIQNAMAFSYLLENGKKNILDDNFYNKELQRIEKSNGNALMTPEFAKEVVKIARDMANMEEKDLRNHIFNRVKEEKKSERAR